MSVHAVIHIQTVEARGVVVGNQSRPLVDMTGCLYVQIVTCNRRFVGNLLAAHLVRERISLWGYFYIPYFCNSISATTWLTFKDINHTKRALYTVGRCTELLCEHNAMKQ